MRRRARDTVIVSVAGGLIVIAAIVSQTLHAQATAPDPTPSAHSSAPTAAPPTTGMPASSQTPGE
ncbi:hypothetical protein GCM10022383_25540 [Microbacterium soli]|uniref:Uncharacterized protein n=2 Tax=Microbacterium soli TaxID=446075 RepID=A0ABP7NGV2_9MICO